MTSSHPAHTPHPRPVPAVEIVPTSAALPTVEQPQLPALASDVEPAAITWRDRFHRPGLAATELAMKVGAKFDDLLGKRRSNIWQQAERLKPGRAHVFAAVGTVALLAVRAGLEAKGLKAPSAAGGASSLNMHDVVLASSVSNAPNSEPGSSFSGLHHAMSDISPASNSDTPIADGVLGSYNGKGEFAHAGTVTDTVLTTFNEQYGLDPNTVLNGNEQHDLVEAVLRGNKLSDADATQLSAGAKIHMPSEGQFKDMIDAIRRQNGNKPLTPAAGSPLDILNNGTPAAPDNSAALTPKNTAPNNTSTLPPGLHNVISDIPQSSPSPSATPQPTETPSAVPSPSASADDALPVRPKVTPSPTLSATPKVTPDIGIHHDFPAPSTHPAHTDLPAPQPHVTPVDAQQLQVLEQKINDRKPATFGNVAHQSLHELGIWLRGGPEKAKDPNATNVPAIWIAMGSAAVTLTGTGLFAVLRKNKRVKEWKLRNESTQQSADEEDEDSDDPEEPRLWVPAPGTIGSYSIPPRQAPRKLDPDEYS